MQFTHVHLQTSQLAAQRIFYEDTLGLVVSDESPTSFTVQVGSSRLTFEQSDQEFRYHFAFNIPENQIEDGMRWLEQQGVPLIRLNNQLLFNFVNWDAHSVYFLDAAGNIAEVIARHRLPNTSQAAFGADSLLSVSEVGLATNDVLATVEQLQAELGTPVFDGQGSDTFTAVGDDEGLLIVVRIGRIWYPETGLVAETYPIKLGLASGQEIHAGESLSISDSSPK